MFSPRQALCRTTAQPTRQMHEARLRREEEQELQSRVKWLQHRESMEATPELLLEMKGHGGGSPRGSHAEQSRKPNGALSIFKAKFAQVRTPGPTEEEIFGFHKRRSSSGAALASASVS